ncbi:MAG TPA: RbsD/FucU domain-containing protein [Anaerovoracaceae bacterium]|nr:RbsD/FucU domain-containing protein [Anaerovoracaceae bacterium]
MLKGIPEILSPELLKILCEMGHGDEIVISDGNFPGASCGQRLVRADGHTVCELLDAILTVFPLDSYSEVQASVMQVMPGDPYVPVIWEDFKAIVNQHEAVNNKFGDIERFEFYNRAKKAYAVVQTSDKALYANILLTKGVL